MINYIQLISISALNSKYRIIINFFVFILIYFCFYSNSNILSFCMNETSLPTIAEAKFLASEVTPINTRSIMQREISSFLGYAEISNEQKNIITHQQEVIKQLIKERDFYFSRYHENFNFIERQLTLERELRRIHSEEIESIKADIAVEKEGCKRLRLENENLKNALKQALLKIRQYEK